MDFEKPEYNDEFLRKDGADYLRAERYFKPIMFALQHERVFKKFDALNNDASISKRRMQNAGILSIVLGLIALILAAVDMSLIAPAVEMASECETCDKPQWLSMLSDAASKQLVKVVATIAAVCGLISALTGFFNGGVGKRKRKWLQLRAACELFRQWRWNYYLAHVDQIIDAIGSKTRQEAYQQQFDQAADQFFLECELELDSVMSGFLNGNTQYGSFDQLPDVELASSPVTLSEARRAEGLPIVLDAFDKIRIRSQLCYTNYLLQPQGARRTHPVRQSKELHRTEEVLIVLILVLHAMIVIGVVGDVPAMKGTVVHFFAVVSALTTLAIMCIERGLRPADHISRLRLYFNKTLSIRDRFKSANKDAQKLRIAAELGDASMAELKDFLREVNRSRFVI